MEFCVSGGQDVAHTSWSQSLECRRTWRLVSHLGQYLAFCICFTLVGDLQALGKVILTPQFYSLVWKCLEEMLFGQRLQEQFVPLSRKSQHHMSIGKDPFDSVTLILILVLNACLKMIVLDHFHRRTNFLIPCAVKNLTRSSWKVLLVRVESLDRLCIIISRIKPVIKKKRNVSGSKLRFLMKIFEWI